jgi:hypothetical protein
MFMPSIPNPSAGATLGLVESDKWILTGECGFEIIAAVGEEDIANYGILA